MKDFDPSKYPRFIQVLEKEVTLKFVFDNIRNVGLSALVFTFGAIIFRSEPISSLLSIPYTQHIVGIALCLAGLLLAIANYVQGILAILAIKKLNFVVYGAISFFLHVATFEVFFKQVFNLIKTVGN